MRQDQKYEQAIILSGQLTETAFDEKYATRELYSIELLYVTVTKEKSSKVSENVSWSTIFFVRDDKIKEKNKRPKRFGRCLDSEKYEQRRL